MSQGSPLDQVYLFIYVCAFWCCCLLLCGIVGRFKCFECCYATQHRVALHVRTLVYCVVVVFVPCVAMCCIIYWWRCVTARKLNAAIWFHWGCYCGGFKCNAVTVVGAVGVVDVVDIVAAAVGKVCARAKLAAAINDKRCHHMGTEKIISWQDFGCNEFLKKMLQWFCYFLK